MNAVVDPDHVVATVILVVTDEDVQVVIQCQVVDVAEPPRKHVQVTAIETASQDPALLKQQAVSFGTLHVGAVVTHREVQPPIEPGDHTVGTVKPRIVLLGLQSQPSQQVVPLIGDAIPVGIAKRGQQRRVHHENVAVVPRQSLDRIEPLGVDGRLIGIPVTVGVGDQPHLVTPDNLDAQSGHVVMGHQQRSGSWTDRNHRGVFDQWITGKQGRNKPIGNDQRRKPFLGLRTDSRRLLVGTTRNGNQ